MTNGRENRNNGNQESSSKEASEEGSQENSKEEVSRQRNRQHNRGTPKASPDVFLVKANSSVFMRLAGPIATDQKVCGGCACRSGAGCDFARWQPCATNSVSPFSRFRGWARAASLRGWRQEYEKRAWAEASTRGSCRRKAVALLPKWYWVMPPLDGG